jgi:hypothetical protein
VQQNPSYFGNPAIPEGPVAFRPTIARGLALSDCYLFNSFNSKFNAKRDLLMKPIDF